MKKVLSLSALFAMIVMGACSTAPGQEVVNSLIGTWTSTGVTIVFSDKTATVTPTSAGSTTSQFSLVSDPETLTLGDKNYVVYMATGPQYLAVRADGNNLHGLTGGSIQEIKDTYEADKAENPNVRILATRQ